MLYNPDWKPKVAPPEPWRQILQDAADLIEQRGWIQGTLTGLHGFCAIGALRAVSERRRDLEKAKRRLAAAIPERLYYGRMLGVSYQIMHWNDFRKRTKAEVIEVLRKAAASPS